MGAGAGSDSWTRAWLRSQKQEGEETPGASGNRRSSLNSKLLSVKFLAILFLGYISAGAKLD